MLPIRGDERINDALQRTRRGTAILQLQLGGRQKATRGGVTESLSDVAAASRQALEWLSTQRSDVDG